MFIDKNTDKDDDYSSTEGACTTTEFETQSEQTSLIEGAQQAETIE